MELQKSEVTLTVRPESRLSLTDVSEIIRRRYGDRIYRYRKALYCSYHTTAGYLEEQVCARLRHNSKNLQNFVQSFQTLFPPNADYHHDQLDLRAELTEAERKGEPKNADAHLTFISSGLTNCVTYVNQPQVPVYFIDLDGINGRTQRLRQTTVVGFDRELPVAETEISLPVSKHPIDSVNLKNPDLGFFERLLHHLRIHGIKQGRVDLTLDQEEQHAGLTVNEYETLLMRHDLADVLSNPLRFMAERGRHMILDPRKIPVKAKGYAKYDFVQVLNEFLDSMGLSESLLERLIHKFLAFPASRFLRMKKSISLLVLERPDSAHPAIVQGTYQSPILVQWGKAPGGTRKIRVTFTRFL